MIDLNKLIMSASAMPALPTSVTRLASLVVQDDIDLHEIIEVIAYDQSLTAKLLRWANSGASAAESPILTVDTAVMRLGTGVVLEAAMAAAVGSQLEREIPQYGYSEGELWRHSLAAALAVETIKKNTSVEIPPESFTTALLHDIGKLVLMRYLSPDVLSVLEEARASGGVSERQAEVDVLNVHHGEVGGLIAQNWKLPQCIINGIIYHHSPEEIDEPVCYAVQIANVVAKTIGTGAGKDSVEDSERESSLNYFSLSEDDFEAICSQVSDDLGEVEQRFN